MQRRLALDDTRPIWRSMLVFLVPLMLSNILQSASGTLSSIYLGRLIGVRALAAASSFFPIIFFMIAFFIGIASASSVLIGQAYGARDEERLKAVAGTTLTIAIGSGAVVAIGSIWFLPPLLHLIGTPADVFDDALAYAHVLFYSLPLLFVYIAYTTFVRGTGDSRTPFLSLIVSTVLIVLFTPWLIRGWLGFPQFGIIGAALANIFANVVAFAFLLVALAREKNPLALDMSIVRHMNIEQKLLVTLIRIGIPTGVQMVMVSLAEVAVIALVRWPASSSRLASGVARAVGQ